MPSTFQWMRKYRFTVTNALIDIHFTFCRVMQDRREQARQDLKGLEETVVSYGYMHLDLYSEPPPLKNTTRRVK